jgi:hypothetical protein
MAREMTTSRYELILESTRDADGLVHKDEAVKLFKESARRRGRPHRRAGRGPR